MAAIDHFVHDECVSKLSSNTDSGLILLLNDGNICVMGCDCISLSNIKFCPYCGENLTLEDEDYGTEQTRPT